MLQEVNSDSLLKLFDLLSVVFVIIIIHKGLPQRILPLTCSTKVLLFRTLSTCRWQERSKQIPCRRLAILEDICKINDGLFTLLPHL